MTQRGFTRRAFLQGSGLTLLALGAGGWVAARLADGSAKALAPLEHLGAAEQQMLARVADALLDGLLPADGPARDEWLVRIVRNTDAGIPLLPLHLQKDTHKLLSLLAFAPTRLLLIGQWHGWQSFGRAELQARLDTLRTSGKDLHRVVYRVLHDVVKGGFYGDRASWELLSYPGPVVDFKQNG